jgi:hypothetical protein
VRRWAIFCVFALALVGVIANDLAQAQQSTDRQRAFKTLISAGFEIKSVTTAPINPAKTYAEAQILVTLQKGKGVAVCTFSYANYDHMADEVLADARWCDVRLYD